MWQDKRMGIEVSDRKGSQRQGCPASGWDWGGSGVEGFGVRLVWVGVRLMWSWCGVGEGDMEMLMEDMGCRV